MMEGDRERLAAALEEIERLRRAGQDAVRLGLESRQEAEAEVRRLRSAAARALERTQVCDGLSGSCEEATAILSQVVNLDGSPVPPRGA